MKNGSLREVQSEIGVRPSQDEELKGGAGAPEKRCHGQGDLTKFVVPKKRAGFAEIDQCVDRTEVLFGVAGAGVRDQQVDRSSSGVDKNHDGNRGLSGIMNAEDMVTLNKMVNHRRNEQAA